MSDHNIVKHTRFPKKTYVKGSKQEEGGLQAHREDEAEDGGGDEDPDTVGLRQDDDDRQGHQHGDPQQG